MKSKHILTLMTSARLMCLLALVCLLLVCASCGRDSGNVIRSVSADFYADGTSNTESTETDEPVDGTEEAEEVIDDAGVGVSEIDVNSERHLIMTLNDDSTVDAGYIGGEESKDGCYVAFVDYNDALLKLEIVEKGGDATPPADPSRENHTFAGWDKAYTGIKKDTVVTATYTEAERTSEAVYYTVTYADYDGTTLETQQVEEGHSATPPTDISREGYSFVGWDAPYDCIIADTTFVAQYSEDTEALIAAGNVAAQVGESGVQMVIEIKNNPGIAGAAVEVGYDVNVLTLADVVYGDDFTDGGEQPNAETSPVSLVWTGLDEVSGDSVYATLYFDVLDSAVSGETYTVSIGCESENIFDIDEENVSFGLKDGSITIE